MSALRKFEIEAIRLMAEDVLDKHQLSAVEALSTVVSYEYTGSGYYLTLAHQSLPQLEQTLATPAVVGESGNIRCGFVAFLGNGELVLECHSWGEIDVPSDFRELPVVISTSSASVVGPRA